MLAHPPQSIAPSLCCSLGCRDCWVQQPEERPAFDEVVGRLRRLLAEAAGD